MTATEALERRIDELCRENERLRQERDEWRRVAESKQDIIDHMRDARGENAKLRAARDTWQENDAKLRELVRDMWEMQDALPYGAHIEIRDRMRELGVDEC